MIEIVDPLLSRDKTGAINSRPRIFGDGGIDGSAAFRVLGAVFISCQIQPTIEFEPVDQTVAAKGRMQRSRDRATCMGDVTTIGAAEPAPDIGLGRWDFTSRAA
jgi:hypothetical protein